MSTTLSAEAADEIRRGLYAICQQVGLAPNEASLLRYTINAVYKIGDRVLRLSKGEIARERANRVVQGAALLRQQAVPTIELDSTIAQPVQAGEWVATIWHYIPHSALRPDAIELAEPLRRLHSIASAPSFLPRWSPVETARRRLDSLSGISAEDHSFVSDWSRQQVGVPLNGLIELLLDRCDELDSQVRCATWQLPIGVIHGDAHVGNLIAGRLCDFDSMSIGPQEWDLVPLLHSATRFGDPVAPYKEFAGAYGFDLARSPAWPLLREVRELQLVTSVLDKFYGRPEMAQTLAYRMQTYLTGDRSATWQRYR